MVGVSALLFVVAGTLARPILRGDHVALRGKLNPIRDRLRVDASTGFRAEAMEMNRWIPAGTTLAGEQTGALSYFAVGGRRVVNLDGVVNPDAYRARLHNDTQGYIKSRGIHWFADNQLFLTLVILELNSRPGHVLNLGPGPVRVRFRPRSPRRRVHSPCSSSASTIPRPDHRGPASPQVAAAATAATSSSVGRKLMLPTERCT